MAGSPVINLAARILQQVAAGEPADLALRAALQRTRHRSAPAERRDVSRAVFAYFRWWRWLGEGDSAQKQLADALELQARFDRNPAAFKPEALAARAAPDWVKNEIPWPEAALSAPAHDPRALEGKRPYPTEVGWLQQLQREPVLWIRTKTGLENKISSALGHCDPAAVAGRAEAGATAVLPLATSALRYSGAKDLFYTDGFQAGEFEIQDLASQLVGVACAPQAGETWWDACAGEGGKTLHLADLMQNKGMLWASDRSVRRLTRLKERAARAKVFNYRAASWEGTARLPTKTKFDGILVDAPCSGLGTWQRNPHARWTTQPVDVAELAAVQTRLLDHVAGSLKPGGRLIYAVCTLTRSETTEVARSFTDRHPEFEASPLSTLNAQLSTLILWPHQLNANGMFIAAWRRK